MQSRLILVLLGAVCCSPVLIGILQCGLWQSICARHCCVVFDASSSELVWLYGVGHSIFGTVGWFVAVQCWYILLGSFVAVPMYVVLACAGFTAAQTWYGGVVWCSPLLVLLYVCGWLLCIWCRGIYGLVCTVRIF